MIKEYFYSWFPYRWIIFVVLMGTTALPAAGLFGWVGFWVFFGFWILSDLVVGIGRRSPFFSIYASDHERLINLLADYRALEQEYANLKSVTADYIESHNAQVRKTLMKLVK
jgi:hypothetical protein